MTSHARQLYQYNFLIRFAYKSFVARTACPRSNKQTKSDTSDGVVVRFYDDPNAHMYAYI